MDQFAVAAAEVWEGKPKVPAPSYVDDSLRSFLLSLSRRSREPAGGSALAVAGASAAALVSLACHIASRRNGRSEKDEQTVGDCHGSVDPLLHRIQSLIDEDVTAYQQVRRALRLPQSDDRERAARREALDHALLEAIEIPLQLASASLEVYSMAARTIPAVDLPVIGDLIAAMDLSEASTRGSLRNARINASSLSGEDAQRLARERIAELTSRLESHRAEAQRILLQTAPDYAEAG